jgi:signal transduction histidine kinase
VNAPPMGSIARPTLIAFGVVLVLILGYDLVERVWLSDADLGTIYMLHRLRGAAAALIAGALASWLILRRTPPLLAVPGAPERQDETRTQPEEKRLHFARWFVRMRWIAVVVAAVLIVAATEIFGLLPGEVAPRLAATVAVLALTNVGYTLYLKSGLAGPHLLRLQVYTDVAILILLLHFSGGIENPLLPLTLLHVIIAGIVLERGQSYLVAAAASVLFAFVAWGEWSGFLPHYPLALFPHVMSDGVVAHAAFEPLHVGTRVVFHAAILFLVAFFTTSLTERIRRDELRLERLADQTRAQAQLLERSLETTETAICVDDRELETFWANDRWKAWLSETPELCGVVGGGESPRSRTLADGRVRVVEVATSSDGAARAARDGGPGRVLQLVTAPLLDREGRISHVVTLARDVTEQKVAQAALIRAERLAALGELAGQVAHEVNNPIAILSAKARLLLRDHRGELAEPVTTELAKIIELADRVARIAQGLLSFCRPIHGLPAALDVRDPIRAVLADVQTRAAELGVRIHDDLPEELPLVLAVADELEQIFLNLFLNSLDAMARGGDLRVSARPVPVVLESGAQAVEVVVEDTGHGIPTQLQARVFEPFLTTKAERRGSGLGLSICLGLVRGHGGEIEVESEPGRFTRVHVRLRAAPAGVVRSVGDAKVAPEPEVSHA